MPKTILYVDDEPWFVEALFDALTDTGYSLKKAKNGTEALKYLKQADVLPDLIVLDVIMPTGEDIPETNGGRRTGIKVHEIIRKEMHITDIPILFLTVVDDSTVEGDVGNLERSIGIKNYSVLVKPVLPTELLERVAFMLKRDGK
jgi:CheY-like chemotaxis protein